MSGDKIRHKVFHNIDWSVVFLESLEMWRDMVLPSFTDQIFKR